MKTKELYDSIGRGYRSVRQPDPRIEQAIHKGLGGVSSVLNVGAGAGSYEPTDRRVVAVEPSMTMIRQRPKGAAPAIRATSQSLPFDDAVFAASLAILTIHHWPDQTRGLRELRRVARSRVVIVTWDPSSAGFWLTDYLPEILEIDRGIFPTIEDLCRELGSTQVSILSIPHDCTDGFLGAYWRRPAAYLDTAVRLAISTFSKLTTAVDGLEKLRRDLASGEWNARHGSILSESSLDIGYRLIVAEKNGMEGEQ